MSIGIIGCGAFGLAISSLLKNNDIVMWTKFIEEKELLEKEKSNEKILPGYKIGENVSITLNLTECMKDKDYIFIAIPSIYVEDILLDIKKMYRNQRIIVTSKGLSKNGELLSTLIEKNLQTKNYAIISGPTFAIDLINDSPVGFTVATLEDNLFYELSKLFNRCHVQLAKDVVGIEYCGVLKNIYAIISGLLDSLNVSNSTKAYFYTNSIYEMCNIIQFLGGNQQTILSYAGIGDFLLTATSNNSRNYSFGIILGTKSNKEINEYIKNMTIEGYNNLKNVVKLLEGMNSNTSLEILYKIICGEYNKYKIMDIFY